jgi:hypothetical protein
MWPAIRSTTSLAERNFATLSGQEILQVPVMSGDVGSNSLRSCSHV